MDQAGVDGRAGSGRSRGLSRRGMLMGMGAGAAGLALSPVLAACTGSSGGGGSSSSVSIGSNYSDPVPKKAFAALVAGFQKANSGDKATVNTVDHNDFQDNINNYLQGSPQDVFTWFAGFRMRFYAKKGLVAPLDDVWSKVGSNFSDAFAKASTGDDGKKYFVPLYNYPWAFFYRKSLWQQKGYQVPTTSDELNALCTQMKKDGLSPIGFADKDQWPACGTFDYLNMRINGYDFHIALMAHQKSWASHRGREASSTRGRACCPTTTPTARSAAPGRTPRSCSSRRRTACTCSGRSSPSSSPAPTSPTSTSSRSRSSTRPTGRTRSRHRSTG